MGTKNRVVTFFSGLVVFVPPLVVVHQVTANSLYHTVIAVMASSLATSMMWHMSKKG